MAVDNTHTKYLRGADKTTWNNFKEAYEAQQKLETFMAGFGGVQNNLKEGEELEIPVRKSMNKKKEENK